MSVSVASKEQEGTRPAASAEAVDSAPVPELQFREMFQIVRRRKFLVLGLALCGVLGALLVNFKSKKMYSSTAIIEVNVSGGAGTGLNDLSGIATGAGGGGGEDLATELTTQQAIIKSGSVALNVAEELNLAASPAYSIPADEKTKNSALYRERDLPLSRSPLQQERVIRIFGSHLQVAVVKDTRLLSVTYTDPSPEEAARIANAVIAAYTLEYSRARFAASKKAFSGLSDQLADLKAEVFESERKVAEYERRTGLVTPATAGTTASGVGTAGVDVVSMNRFIELNRELTAARVSRIAREAIYRMSEARDPDLVLGAASSQLASSAGDNSVLSPGSADLAQLASLREQKSRLALQQAADAKKYGAKNPLMMDLQNEAAELDTQIGRELARIQERAKRDYELLSAYEQGLQVQVSMQRQELTKVSGDANQLLLLAQEQASSRQLYQDLYAKLEEARVAAGLRSSNITVIDPARLSTTPSSPVSRRNLVLGFAAGLASGLFLTFLLDGLDDSLGSAGQVAQVTSIPVLAKIPLSNGEDGERSKKPGGVVGERVDGANAWLLKAPRSPSAEALRSLRVLLRRGPGQIKSILFTSPEGEAGKSTLCFNTAVAFALQGERVLLIDASMRRPSIHALAGISNSVGLSEYLNGDMTLGEVTQSYRFVRSLLILPSGSIPEMPSELLGSSRFADLLKEAIERYDRVLIDSPSLLSVTDPLILSALVDQTLVVFRSRKTKGATLRKALAHPSLRGSHLGLVLNGVDARSDDFYHGAADDGREDED